MGVKLSRGRPGCQREQVEKPEMDHRPAAGSLCLWALPEGEAEVPQFLWLALLGKLGWCRFRTPEPRRLRA